MSRRRAWLAAGLATVLLALAAWVVAIVQYDPWRRSRVRAALAAGDPWSDAVIAAEEVAFPNSEGFSALCTDGTTTAAAFERDPNRRYVIVQYGQVEQSGLGRQRIMTSEERFATRLDWSKALRDLGQRLRCKSVVVIWPPTDAVEVDLDESGRVRRAPGSTVD